MLLVLKYILKRIAMIIPVIIGITLFVYTILALAPGDPASLILGPDALPEQLEAMRIELGLHKPIIIRYIEYMSNAVRGDFGRSWLNGKVVLDEFIQRIPHTFMMALLGTLISAALGISLGILVAIKHNTPIDYTTLGFALVMAAIPNFWTGMIFQIVFALNLGWFPVMGVGTFRHYILPCSNLGISWSASNIRLTRSSMLDVMTQDYVRTARAKGGSEGWVIRRHVVRNGLLPVITNVGLQFASILSGAIVSETVFAIPGIGSYVIMGARSRDIPIVMGVIFFVGIFTAVINLIIDFVYAIIDPRVKLE